MKRFYLWFLVVLFGCNLAFASTGPVSYRGPGPNYGVKFSCNALVASVPHRLRARSLTSKASSLTRLTRRQRPMWSSGFPGPDIT